MPRHSLATPLLVVGVTAAVVTGLFLARPESPVRPEEPEPVTMIEVADVRIGDHTVQLPSHGFIEAGTSATLAAQVSGTVTEVSPQFGLGGEFHRGDWLLSIDDRDYLAAAKLAEANQHQAEVALMEERARAEQAVRDWQRLASGEEPNDLVMRKPQLAAAESHLQAMQAQLSQARLNLERTRITAPYGGRILRDLVDVGDYLTPGTLVADISGTETLEVKLPISADWRTLVDWRGQIPVTLSVSVDGQTHSWYGKVVRTSADIDSDSRQFYLVAEVDPAASAAGAPRLLLGDYVEAEIRGRTLQDVAVIPRRALVDGNFVWRVEQSRIYKRPVEVAWKDQHFAVVNRGLVDGDRVNLTPLGHIISGALVEIMDPDESRPGLLGAEASGERTEPPAKPGIDGVRG